MDKDKKLKGPKNRPISIDGIVPGGRILGVPIGKAYKPNPEKPTPSLGNSTPRADGFHPARQSAGSLGQAPDAEEEALLDDPRKRLQTARD